MCKSRVAVVGVGNILMGDDGVGVRAVEALRERDLPPGVDLYDAGTAIYDVAPRLTGYAAVIVVDAARFGGVPGEVRCFDLDVDALGSDGRGVSSHNINLVAALRLQMVAGDPLPPVRVVGVEPGEVALNLELSDDVRVRLDEAAETALKEAETAMRACAQTGGRI